MFTDTMTINEVSAGTEKIIPAVKGKFYSYSAHFSTEKPLYFLMDCKANKGRSLNTDKPDLERELDLVFIFDNSPLICSPDSPEAKQILNGLSLSRPRNTDIRSTNISLDVFYHLYDEKAGSDLIDVYESSYDSNNAKPLHEGLMLALKTSSGKYGLITIKDLTESSCTVDACHILL